MPKAAIMLALASGIVMVVAGVTPWLALSIAATWAGSLWLSRPEPAFEQRPDSRRVISPETIAPFIEPLAAPLLLLADERIVAANQAARASLGNHVVGQDARVALRHPEAVGLLSDGADATVTVPGLSTPRSVWQISQFRIDQRYRLIELVDQTADADVSRAHSDFVANASHELRTPLASIIGYLETMLDTESGLEPGRARKFLGTMSNEARRMQVLVEDLMSLSRIEAEKHDVPRDCLDLGALVHRVIAEVEAVEGAGRIVCPAGVEEALVPGDVGQLEQLVRNLIDNSLKYGDRHSPVRIGIESSDSNIWLRVADSGPGIAPEHLPHLTRRFYRTDPGRSRASGGTGLGLAIVKHIVERHRGDLAIASTAGEGTIVTVRLPRAGTVSH